MTTIFLNPYANSGKGLEKWQRIKTELNNRLGKYTIVQPSTPEEIVILVAKLIREGQTTFIAAGGDGTVNLVLNAIIQATTEKERGTINFGAIGLGSSNDFHKPFSHERMLAEVPVRINTKNIRRHDVGKISYKDAAGRWQHRYFIINASIGVTAWANWLYNSGEAMIEWLQKRSVAAAILWAAVKTIAGYHNIPAAIGFNGSRTITTAVTNLGIIKNPHFAGDFCYDTPIAPDSGDFGVNLCEHMGMAERLNLLYHLSRHSFAGRPKTWFGRAQKLHVQTENPIPLETDGEIVMANEAYFEILPKALRVCQ